MAGAAPAGRRPGHQGGGTQSLDGTSLCRCSPQASQGSGASRPPSQTPSYPLPGSPGARPSWRPPSPEGPPTRTWDPSPAGLTTPFTRLPKTVRPARQVLLCDLGRFPALSVPRSPRPHRGFGTSRHLCPSSLTRCCFLGPSGALHPAVPHSTDPSTRGVPQTAARPAVSSGQPPHGWPGPEDPWSPRPKPGGREAAGRVWASPALNVQLAEPSLSPKAAVNARRTLCRGRKSASGAAPDPSLGNGLRLAQWGTAPCPAHGTPSQGAPCRQPLVS